MDSVDILQRAILDGEIEDDRTGDNESILDYMDNEAAAPTARDQSNPTSRQDFPSGHSYRNFNPEKIRVLYDNAGRDETKELLSFIESGRIEDICEAISEFFYKLDTDEMELFTDRNPDLVQFMSAYNESRGLNPYEQFYRRAKRALADDRSAAVDPPMFERREITHDTLLDDMMYRRRSYRNWSPSEFYDIAERPEIEITRGMAREMDMFTPEDREEIDFPIMQQGKFVARTLFDRIEDGRFDPVLSQVQRLFVRLDLDERRLIASRNPGLLTWIGPWGYSEDVFSRDPREMQIDYPPLGERGRDSAAATPSTQIGAFTQARARDADDEIPVHILEAAQTFDAPFGVQSSSTTSTYAEQHTKWYDAKNGITGLYIPDDTMIMDDRGLNHHPQQWLTLMQQRDEAPPEVMPWATTYATDHHIIEVGISHGGLTQALRKTGHYRDVDQLQSGKDILPEYLWAVIYACRLGDLPRDAIVDYNYLLPRFRESPMGEQFGTSNRTRLGDFYDELQFSPAGLPDPVIDREALSKQG